MKQLIVQEGQTIVDIALQELGSVEGLFDLLEDNPSFDLDTDLTIGQKVYIDEEKIVKPEIVEYYQNQNIIVSGGF